MSNRARLSETEFNPESGVDLDSIAERFDERETGFEAAADLDFDTPPDVRKMRTSRLARFS